MPVIIHRRTPPPPKPPGPRRRYFDQAVRKLAPMVAEVREAGHKSVEEIMHALNARRIAAPNGKVFTFGTTHRVLCRLYELGLGPKLRTVSQALSARPYKQRASRASARMARALALARIRRAHPELLEGLHQPTAKPVR
jgi:hypothetical protein